MLEKNTGIANRTIAEKTGGKTVLAGDSGSPSYVFNENSGKWEWVGAGQSQGGSGYGEFSQMRSGNQGASDYVVKPVNPEELLRKIKAFG